jgi:transposase
MKAYSQDLRDRVISAYNKGTCIEEIVEMFNICKATAKDWIARYIATGDYSSKQGTAGRPPYKFDNRELILDFISKNPDADGISIRDEVAPGLAMSTFYDTLKRMEITFKKKSQNTKSAKK